MLLRCIFTLIRRRPQISKKASVLKIKDGVKSDQREPQEALDEASFLRESIVEKAEIAVTTDEFFNLYTTVRASRWVNH